jgi:hypothetical protein
LGSVSASSAWHERELFTLCEGALPAASGRRDRSRSHAIDADPDKRGATFAIAAPICRVAAAECRRAGLDPLLLKAAAACERAATICERRR